jgi:nicotinamide phosphoribosyltransferase
MQQPILFQEKHNIILATDSYKASHHRMLPDGLEYMESYFESRGGEFPFILFFGLQYFIKSYLVGKQVTVEKLEAARQFYAPHLGNPDIFNYEGWKYILDTYDGVLPIKIYSVREGSIVPTSNMMFKVKSSDENCVWLCNWIETLLMKVWYPCTIATNSMAGGEILEMHMAKSGMSGNVNFLLHDFGYRGVTSEEQAWLGGAAHLLTFNGSDNIAGVRMLMEFYNAPMCAFNIPASEHSVMCAGGMENEIDTYRRILKRYPSGYLSLVSDTWDIYNVCKFLSEDEEIRNMILNRDGKLVIRPDSGDPATVLEQCLELLAEGFGFTVNEKGYKVLNPKIGLIQGDGINIHSMNSILNYLEHKGWSIDNLVFGSGGGLLQNVNRDTCKFAIKASMVIVNGKKINIFKDPVTAKGTKTSKTGELHLLWNDTEGYRTYSTEQIEAVREKSPNIDLGRDMMEMVYCNGELLIDQTYEEIIARIAQEKESHDKIYSQQ